MHLTASESPRAQEALAGLVARYGQSPVDDADVVVALGGDGFMLSAMHEGLHRVAAGHPDRPTFGLHHGTIGFLMNAADGDELPERVASAQPVQLVPLKVTAFASRREPWSKHALNEVALRRRGPQTASLRVSVDGTVRLDVLAGDGLLVATPAGSAAYNFSAGGPVLPLTSRALALTGICSLRPRRWAGAVLAEHMVVEVDVLETPKRPVEVTADMHSYDRPERVVIGADPTAAVTALFDPGHDLDQRLLAVQFD
jgi:NAD+ kinase